ncbi:sulfate ABC transporter permease subunit CysT [Moraxella nasicaprae]|uniref:Sulfate transport system permease protein CysT n=1 Tax=Moraxella nasicaprae TaxID=2904122 RepID=A0ABY6F704_9GAMM|nr:sulfate ABC transporter permease subunit CysT [Moraxella nasicaprae]UXZ05878.1 sulfate ABC transporter permease subunit CysT [Moraxella nasicaprae]
MQHASSSTISKNRPRRVMPFFGLSMGISIFALSLLVILPFAMMILTTLQMGVGEIIQTIFEPQVFAAIKLSLTMAALATMTNLIFGTLIAWVLVRYEFWGKSLINALVDLPFALPTAVTGIALATLYAPNGLFGQWFASLGMWLIGKPIQIAFTPIGIWLALVVVSFPFIVRAVQPVLAELSSEYEEAAAVMGAGRWTIFRRVILPEITPAMLIGAGMMFARATGEYGSVIFIAGNIPMQSEILPLIIISKLEQFDVAAASCVALFMLLISLVILFAINFAQWKLSARLGAKTN